MSQAIGKPYGPSFVPACGMCRDTGIVRVTRMGDMRLQDIDRQQPCPSCSGGVAISEEGVRIEPTPGGDPQFADFYLSGGQRCGWKNV